MIVLKNCFIKYAKNSNLILMFYYNNIYNYYYKNIFWEYETICFKYSDNFSKLWIFSIYFIKKKIFILLKSKNHILYL